MIIHKDLSFRSVGVLGGNCAYEVWFFFTHTHRAASANRLPDFYLRRRLCKASKSKEIPNSMQSMSSLHAFHSQEFIHRSAATTAAAQRAPFHRLYYPFIALHRFPSFCIETAPSPVFPPVHQYGDDDEQGRWIITNLSYIDR